VSEPIRVLIVDDDVPTRIGLRAILEPELGLEVAGEAADGREACALAESLRPDIVLMDVQLPDLDGIEATRRIVSTDVGDARPRVIVLTTFEVDDYVFRSLRAGASGFLLKRTRAEDLVDAIRVVAGGEALPAPELTRRLIAGSVGAQGDRSAVAEWALTDREAEVLVHVARGFSNKEIADHLHLSTETVRTHVKRMYVKMGVHDRAQAVIAAYENGVVSTLR